MKQIKRLKRADMKKIAYNRIKFQKTQLINSDRLILMYLFLTSVLSNIFFYFTLASKAIGFGDSWARINIARRVIDTLTPGIAQLGGIWLPFPQLLLVPFAAIDVLYFNGIAGAFISSPAFILGGIYLYKILKKVTGSTIVSFMGTLLYASNLNMLYLQTTSMSESLFITSLLGVMYHFIIWTEDIKKHILSLLIVAFWTFTATFTRYEGYLLFLVMIVSVGMTALVKSKKFKVAEGLTVLFVTLAGFGILLWQVYSWAIFGNPLNWYKIYTGQIAVISTINEKPVATWGVTDYRGDLQKSITSIIESVLQMNGIIFVIPLLIGFVLLVPKSLFQKKNWKFCATPFVIFIAAVPLLFLILSSFKGTALVKNPPVDKNMILNPYFYQNTEYNIRYGMTSLPLLIIFTALLFSSHTLLKGFFVLFTVFQLIIMYIGYPTTIYSFPHRYLYVGSEYDEKAVDWFHQNYDGGLILISAIANDQFMYSLKIPFKNYIYEGTNKYWKETVVNPVKYAKWIMMQNGTKVTSVGGSADFVSYYLQDTDILKNNYDLVYKDAKMIVYKIKEKLNSS